MRLLPPAIAFFVLPLLLCGCGPRADEEPVLVGCVAASSGADRADGVAVRQGVTLAADDSPELRIDRRRVEVVAADDRSSDETTEAAGVRLLSVSRVAALIGGADPARALRLARAAQPYRAPVVLPCECAGPLPGDAVFTLGVRPGWRGQVLARYASGAPGAKRAFVLIDGRNPVAEELAAGFVREWPGGAGTVEQATYQADADLAESTARAAAAKANVILIAAAPADFRKAAAQLESAGPHAPLLYGGEDAGAAPLAGRGDAATATAVSLTDLTDRGQDFAKRYQKRFNEPPDWPACQGYDAARVLFDAMSRAKTTAADHVRDQLASTSDFECLTGPLRFKEGRARRRVFVVSFHDGQAKTAQAVDPEPDAPPKTGG